MKDLQEKIEKIIKTDQDRYNFVHAEPFLKYGHWTGIISNPLGFVVRFQGIDIARGGITFVMFNSAGLHKFGLVHHKYIKDFIKTEKEIHNTLFLDDAEMGILEEKGGKRR